jgi:hypothetical protein
MRKGAPEGAPRRGRSQPSLLADALEKSSSITPPPGGLFGIGIDTSGKLFARYRSIDYAVGDNLTRH